MAKTSISRVLQEQVAYLRSPHPVRLRFPEKLEQHFERKICRKRSRRLRARVWWLTALYLLSFYGSTRGGPGPASLGLLLRFGVVLPWLIAANEVLRRNPRVWMREGSVAVTACLMGATSLFLYRTVPPELSSGVQMGLLVCLLLTNVVLRLRFVYALGTTLFCIFADALFLTADHSFPVMVKLSSGYPVAFGALCTLAVGYSLEREERLGFLLKLQHRVHSEELTSMNRELERVSLMDHLTALANRAAMEQQLVGLWKLSIASGSPLSALVVDIDHFKRINDTQGHLYGDKVIARVASLLQQALRGKQDFAARYGGEEFVVLLPNTELRVAAKIAERIRTLVDLAGSPFAGEEEEGALDFGLWVTVSCGVATVQPTREGNPKDLLEAADAALYEAKRTGRNRVCLAGGRTAVPAGGLAVVARTRPIPLGPATPEPEAVELDETVPCSGTDGAVRNRPKGKLYR